MTNEERFKMSNPTVAREKLRRAIYEDPHVEHDPTFFAIRILEHIRQQWFDCYDKRGQRHLDAALRHLEKKG